MDVAYSRVVRFVSERPNAQKPDSEFKSVFCCIEGFRVVIIHVFKNCVHDKVWLLIVDQHRELQQAIEADSEYDEYGETGTTRCLKCRLSFEVHTNWGAKQV